MRENAEHSVKVCGTCGRPLDYLVEKDQGQEVGRYCHADEEYGKRTHVVVPLDPSEITITPACDFCFKQNLTTEDDWTVVCEPFVIDVGPGLTQNMSSLWAACTDCKVLIERGRWSQLVKRVLDAMEERSPSRSRRDRTQAKKAIEALYERVSIHVVAIRRPLPDEMETADFAPDPG